MITVVGQRSCKFQNVSITVNTVNQNRRGTNKQYKINLVCTTLQFPEAHNNNFLFPKDTKSVVKHTFFSCTVSLNNKD